MARFERALVVGASSGIGAAVARRLTADGSRVAVVARREGELTKLAADCGDDLILPVAHDVTDTAAVPELFDRICNGLGGLDLIVYAAGVMPRVGADQFPTASDLEMLDINLGGAIAWLNAAAARFHEARGGTIVGIGSMAGERGRRAAPVYGATKAGLHTYLESLRNRLSVRGVRVVTVKPGFVATPMTEGQPGLFWLISAGAAAEQIVAAAGGGPEVVYVPKRWRAVSAAVRAIPTQVFRRLPI